MRCFLTRSGDSSRFCRRGGDSSRCFLRRSGDCLRWGEGDRSDSDDEGERSFLAFFLALGFSGDWEGDEDGSLRGFRPDVGFGLGFGDGLRARFFGGDSTDADLSLFCCLGGDLGG